MSFRMMDRRDPYSPKNISKRSKRLQKLAFFCAACHRQCSSEHGMVLHCRTQPHNVQLKLFNADRQKFLNEHSHAFKSGYLDILKRRYRNKQVDANLPYQEYIRDPRLPHMNATRWTTLSGFVQYLKEKGICSAEKKGKNGWLIKYVDTNPENVHQEEQKRRRENTALDDQDREGKMVEQMMERDKARAKENKPHHTELQRNGEAKVAFSFAANVDRKKHVVTNINSALGSMVKTSARPIKAVNPRKRSRSDSDGVDVLNGIKSIAAPCDRYKKRKSAVVEDESGKWVKRIKMENSRGWGTVALVAGAAYE